MVRRFEEAVSAHQNAAVIFRETGDRQRGGGALANLASIYEEVRQPGQAAACWQEAAATMRETVDNEKPRTWNS